LEGNFTVYDRGGPGLEGGSSSYDFYQGKQYLLSITSFPSDRWSERELSDRPTLPEVHYLGEAKAMVYLSQCTDQRPCVDDTVRSKLEQSFRITSQDLKSFTDSNFGFSFVYEGTLDFQNTLDQGLQSLLVNHEDKSEFLSISLFQGLASDLKSYNSSTPSAVRHLGNRDWQVYKSVVDNIPRADFVSVFGDRDLLVVSLEGVEKILSLGSNAARIVRSLSSH